MLEAALTRLDELRGSDPLGPADLYDDLARHYDHRRASLRGDGDPEGGPYAEHYFRYLELSRTLLDVERQAALRLRDEGRIADEALRQIEHELDLSEARLVAVMDDRTAGTR